VWINVFTWRSVIPLSTKWSMIWRRYFLSYLGIISFHLTSELLHRPKMLSQIGTKGISTTLNGTVANMKQINCY